MKFVKLSSIVLLSVFFIWMTIPQLQAKQHHKSRTSFSFNLNVGPTPRYVEYNTPTPVLSYYEPVVPVYYAPRSVVEQHIVAPAPTPYYREKIIVERPYVERVYVHPQFSYWRY